MPALSRWLSPIGGLAVALSATAGQGYLPTVGPAPVRFETPAPPAPVMVALPPLVFIEPRPLTDTNETVASTSPAAATAPPNLPGAAPTEATTSSPAEVTVFVSPLGPLEPTGVATNSLAAPAETEVIAPQMLLKYFMRPAGTNSAGVSIFAPVGFVPPQPLAPPSSSATFQTTPPAKP
jgi:hypothetical protein